MARASAASHSEPAGSVSVAPQGTERGTVIERKRRIQLLVWACEVIDHLFSAELCSSCAEPYLTVGASLTETVHLAVAILDKCFGVYPRDSPDATLQAVSAILLASKYLINSDFNAKTAHRRLGVPLDAVVRAEANLWRLLGYDVAGVETLYKLCFSILSKALGGRDPSCVFEENPETFRVFELMNEALVLTWRFSESHKENVYVACALLKESFCFCRYPRYYFLVRDFATEVMGCDKRVMGETAEALVDRVLKTARKVEYIRDRHVSALALLSFEEV